MSRRPSRANGAAAAAANTWVTRTPSGLPLCRTCHKELGFCSHSPMITRDRAKSVSRGRTGSILGLGLVPGSASTLPTAIAANTAAEADQPPQEQESDVPPNHSPGRGTKRQCSGVQGLSSGKGKRRGISAQRKGKQGKQGGSASAAPDDAEEAPAERTPLPHSTRSAKKDGKPSNNNKTEGGAGNASSDRGSDCDNADDEGRDGIVGCDALLRFPGFGLNPRGKECLGCYQAENIMINFGCEERRAKERRELAKKEAAAAAAAATATATAVVEGGTRSAEETKTSAGGTVASSSRLDASVSHVMCLDCFKVYVESRVNERKLVTSREFDGYTVGCPMGCADSCVHPSCFEEVLGAAFMIKYRRFAAIHFASHMRIIWCPGCHCGVLPSAATAAAAIAARQNASPEIQLPLPSPPTPRRRSSNSLWWGLWAGLGGASPLPQAAAAATATAADTATAEAMAVLAEEKGRQEGAEAGAGAGAGAGAVATPGRPTSSCIGCPGCQASLCLSCKALHEPGVSCDDARAMVDGLAEAEVGAGAGGEGEGGGGGGAMSRLLGRSRGAGAQKQASESTKRCPRCHVPIFKDGGCNHMQCSMCQHEFCWLHLTEWVVGGECQRGHWSSNPVLNRAYNTQRVAGAAQSSCTIS